MSLSALSYASPAKINLFLAIVGKRSDGYHDLVSLMYPIALADTLILESAEEGVRITCDHEQVPTGETNLAYRAAMLFINQWSKVKSGRPFGLNITIEKRIPVAAGLGGGSSNAATILLALNRSCGHPFDPDELAALALKLGADVPFFIYQCPAIATGVGEELKPVPPFLKGFTIVLVYPKIKVRTADVYHGLNLRLTKCLQHLKNSNLYVKGEWCWNKPNEIADYLCNDLETVTLPKYPEIIEIKELLSEEGALGTLMSGSGPTVFGLYESEEKAEKARVRITTITPWSVFVTKGWQIPKR